MALDGTTAILETQLLPKEELYKRWFGATHEEIARHFTEGELCAYERHKGPINGIVWCKPGHVYYQSQVSYSNPDLYDYNDDSCDYFLLEDVVRCETDHPEYIGNVTPEGLGLVQTASNKEVPHAGLVALSADEAINRLKITPIELVDILNGYNVSIDVDNLHIETKRLVTVDEEAFREHANSGWNEKFFNVKGLGNVKIYQVDFDRYCEMWGIQEQTQPEAVNTSGLESQLAEAHQRIEELEKQPTAATPMPDNGQGKGEGAWEDSVTAACKAVAHVLQEGRRDWVSGQEKGTGDTDSAGKETFRALLKRMHPQGIRCRVKAETAAWKVLSDSGYAHTGGRKPNP